MSTLVAIAYRIEGYVIQEKSRQAQSEGQKQGGRGHKKTLPTAGWRKEVVTDRALTVPRQCSPAAGRKNLLSLWRYAKCRSRPRGRTRREYRAGKSLLDLPKLQRPIGSRAEASGDRPGSQLADARSIRRPILVSASADPFAPKARSIDGAWTNVVRSFRSPAACPPGSTASSIPVVSLRMAWQSRSPTNCHPAVVHARQ